MKPNFQAEKLPIQPPKSSTFCNFLVLVQNGFPWWGFLFFMVEFANKYIPLPFNIYAPFMCSILIMGVELLIFMWKSIEMFRWWKFIHDNEALVFMMIKWGLNFFFWEIKGVNASKCEDYREKIALSEIVNMFMFVIFNSCLRSENKLSENWSFSSITFFYIYFQKTFP